MRLKLGLATIRSEKDGRPNLQFQRGSPFIFILDQHRNEMQYEKQIQSMNKRLSERLCLFEHEIIRNCKITTTMDIDLIIKNAGLDASDLVVK